jgi:hypothetical protein
VFVKEQARREVAPNVLPAAPGSADVIASCGAAPAGFCISIAEISPFWFLHLFLLQTCTRTVGRSATARDLAAARKPIIPSPSDDIRLF